MLTNKLLQSSHHPPNNKKTTTHTHFRPPRTHTNTRTLLFEQMQSVDAQQELADEIKLRAEQAKDKTSASTSIVDREDVKAEEAPKEAPAEAPAAAAEESAEAVSAEPAVEGESA